MQLRDEAATLLALGFRLEQYRDGVFWGQKQQQPLNVLFVFHQLLCLQS